MNLAANWAVTASHTTIATVLGLSAGSRIAVNMAVAQKTDARAEVAATVATAMKTTTVAVTEKLAIVTMVYRVVYIITM